MRLVKGAKHCELRLGDLQVVAAPVRPAPFEVDAWVAEEDTFLVLSEPPEFEEPAASFKELIRQMSQLRPKEPGSVVVKRGRPLHLLAIVHDLEQEPSWREQWVVSALTEVFRLIEARGLRSAALPLLGGVHGQLAPERFMRLLHEALVTSLPAHLRRLWLVVPEGTDCALLQALKSND